MAWSVEPVDGFQVYITKMGKVAIQQDGSMMQSENETVIVTVEQVDKLIGFLQAARTEILQELARDPNAFSEGETDERK